jgi:ATP-dependent Clp protease, protease subunit
MTPYLRMRMANKGRGSFRAEGDVIWLYDVIAADAEEAEWWGGISPESVIAALAQTTGPVTMRINSPGGSVFGAQAIVAAMRSHPQPITARVDSLAASAASVIAAEAAVLEVVKGSMIMIHKAWGVSVGNDEEMRRVADLLAKIDENIAQTYARRAETDHAQWLAMMAAETWFDADEAVAAKLADKVVDENLQRPQAKWDLTGYNAAPWQPNADSAPPELQSQPDLAAVMQAMRSRQLAARLVAKPI